MFEPEPEAMFDERRWKKIETCGDGYSPRTGHTVVSYQTSLYVFGGTDRRRRQQDLFQYSIDNKSWSLVNAVGPLPPRRSGALGVVYGHKMYIFGGYDGRDGNYFNDFFYFNFETRHWGEMPSHVRCRPEARTDHIMALHAHHVYIFGGYDGHTRYQNTYRYDLKEEEWQAIPIQGEVPSKRFGHSGIVHAKSNRLIVFGGWDGKDTLNDLYFFDLNTLVWSKANSDGASPPHRYRHTAVVFEDSMFVFGGVDKQHCRYNDLQRFDLRTNTWSEVCTTGFVPSSRTFHRSAVVGNLMYLLGGYDGTDRLHDLYSIHVGTLTPSSLFQVCTNYVRNNYQILPKTFSVLPKDIVDHVIWKRDSMNLLRGHCTCCSKERCQKYEKVRRTSMHHVKHIHTPPPSISNPRLRQMLLACSQDKNLENLCVCGHPCSSHVAILEHHNQPSGRSATPIRKRKSIKCSRAA